MAYPSIKRLFDLLAAGIMLLLLFPILLPLLFLLRFTAEGEVFYFQQRIGCGNRYFLIWKFATMLKDSPHIGTGMITLRNDPRVTAPGRFLRKTKLNELPQLVNVLLGDMSFVGPRPLVDRTFRAYPAEVQERIGQVRPGITGIGSVVFRDEERWISESGMDPHAFYEQHIAPYKGALELWYLDHQNFKVDVLLLFLTGWVILFPSSDLTFRIFRSLPKKPLIFNRKDR